MFWLAEQLVGVIVIIVAIPIIAVIGAFLFWLIFTGPYMLIEAGIGKIAKTDKKQTEKLTLIFLMGIMLTIYNAYCGR